MSARWCVMYFQSVVIFDWNRISFMVVDVFKLMVIDVFKLARQRGGSKL